MKTVGDIVHSNPADGARLAILAPERESLSYAGLRAQLEYTQLRLAALGIGSNDRVAIVLPNGPEMASAASLNPNYRQPEYQFFLSDLQAQALVIMDGLDSPARDVAAQLAIPVIELRPGRAAGQFELLGETGLPSIRASSESNSIALILHTSGTTSRPKMVPLSQANLVASAQHIRRTLALSSDDRCLNVMPLFHIHGLMAAVLATITAGGSVVCTPNFLAPRFFEWFERFQPTWYTAVPTMHQAILGRAADQRQRIQANPLRFVRSSSASLPPEVMADLEQVFDAPVIESYGMTEAAHQMASNPLPPSARKPGSVGLAAGPDVAVMAEDGPELLPVLAAGEIVIRGPNVTAGYLGNSKANQDAFTDGWFWTGDQGYLDEAGYLFISGRLKEIINRGGEKISPREIDEVLLSHPDVQQALTFAMSDPALGEEVAAAVVLSSDVEGTPDLRRFAAEQLADFKVPRRIVVLDEIPKGPTGKLQRIGLAEKLGLEAETPVAQPVEVDSKTLSPLEQAIAEIWCEVLVIEHMGPITPFLMAVGDSVTAVQLANRIRTQLGIHLSLVDFFDAPTVREQARLVEALLVEQRLANSHPPILDPGQVQPEPEFWNQPFPLTDIQQAYWVGRQMNRDLGGVSTHHYYEIDAHALDMRRLNAALARLIAQQGMLPMAVLPDGRQQIAPQVEFQIWETDLRTLQPETAEGRLLDIRAEMSHQVLPADQAPLLDIRASHLPQQITRIHLSFDGLALDFESRRRFMRLWGQLYNQPDFPLPDLEVSFRDYVQAFEALRQTPAYDQRRTAVFAALDQLPPAPQLPMVQTPAQISETRFKRLDWHLPARAWGRIRAQAESHGLTTSGLLLGIYVDVLRFWSGQSEMTINLTAFDRRFSHPQLEHVLGDFTTLTLAPAVGHDPSDPLIERVRQLSRVVWESLDNPVSGIEVLRERARRLGQQQAQMPVVFTSALGRENLLDPAPLDWLGQVQVTVSQTPQVWLDLIVEEIEGRLHVHWNFVEGLFPEGMMADMLSAFGRWISALADLPGAWDYDWRQTVALLLPIEQRQMMTAANDTSADLPGGSLLDGFMAQVAQQPEASALIGDGLRLRYAELDRWARALGRQLRESGARPNQLVAIVMEKGWEQIVAVLGVLYSGAAYLPIDAATPGDRLAELLADAETSLAVTQRRLEAQIPWPVTIQRFSIEVDDPPDSTADLDVINDPGDIAYVIYTSGSTGMPKGVAMDHAGVNTTLQDLISRFALSPQDRVLALTPLTFDLSVFDVFAVLTAGGSLVVPEESALRDPARVAAWMESEQVNLWNSVPTLMGLLLDYLYEQNAPAPGRLRLVMLSGDWIPVPMPDRVRANYPQADLYSLGGATEAAIWSILYEIGKVEPDWNSIPYGTAMQNQQMHVLNEIHEPNPVGVPGELYISGAGLAKGYWRDPQKTAAAFTLHPQSGERLYRTGDLARYRPEGWIELLGRVDFQVKVRGFRVDLGEIQIVLESHPAVQQAIARAFGDRFEEKRLIAYVIPDAGATVDEVELRRFATQRMPAYMLPHRIVLQEAFPLTTSGKIDRAALQEPQTAEAALLPRTSADNPNIKRLQAIVQDAAMIEAVDPDVNLLMAGVNSVEIIRIINRVEQAFGVRPDVNQIYQNPSLYSLLEALEAAGVETSAPESDVIVDLIQDPEARKAFIRQNPGARPPDPQQPRYAFDPTDAVEL